MKNELHALHLDLGHWRPPDEFIRIVERWVVPANRELVRGSGGNFLEEAWVVAQFLKLTTASVEQVRLSGPDEEWPDGHIEIGGLIKGVEVTEVMEVGRRPNEEPPSAQLDPVDSWIARSRAIPDALNAAIKRKVSKRYGSRSMLLVYLNISIGDLRPEEHEIERVIAQVKARYAAFFEEIVVVWRNQLY